MRKLRKACRPIAVIVKGPKIAPTHLREPDGWGGQVHLSGPLWPTLYTLCNRLIERTSRQAPSGKMFYPRMQPSRAKVNCPECMAIIEHVLQEAGK